jgi:hypothetical protein
LWASAHGHEWLKTGRNALIVVAAIVLAPYPAALLLGGLGAAGAHIALLSPLGTLSVAGDVMYKAAKAGYWTSLLLVQAVGWALLAGAVFRLRRGWREDRGETTVPMPATAGEGEAEAAQSSCEPLGDDTNPIVWLVQRRRGLKGILWAGGLVGLSQYWVIPLLFRLVSSTYSWGVGSPLMLTTTAISGALFAWGASRFFVEARRTGELELLLTTPLGAQQSVTTQWANLKRALRWPVVVMLVPALLQAGFFVFVFGRRPGFPPGYAVPLAIGQLLGCVDTIFSIGALCWLGMWFGFQAGGQGRAIAWTVALATGVPYLIGILSWLIFIPVIRLPFGRSSAPYWISAWLPQAVDLLVYLGLIQFARRRLLGGLAGAELMKFDLRQSILSVARDAVAAWRKARHWTPS